MNIRELPPEEWGRLASTQELPIHSIKEGSIVIVAEEKDEIVGMWAATPLVHLEGFWVRPDHRKKMGKLVFKLIGAMTQILDALRVPVAFCWAETSSDVPAYLERLGMTKLPVDTFAYEIKSCQPQSRS